MNMGSRAAQWAWGVPMGAGGLALLILPYVMLGEAPGKWQIGAGTLMLFAGGWLVAPVGMGGLLGELRKAWHEFKGHDDG